MINDELYDSEITTNSDPALLPYIKKQYEYNETFISLLEVLRDFCGETRFDYKYAIDIIKQHNKPINNSNYTDFLNSSNIEHSLQTSLRQYIEKNEVSLIENEKNKVNFGKLLRKVYDIGNITATKLINRNKIKCISQLRKNDNLLNSSQYIGLLFFTDSLLKIPRYELDLYDKVFNYFLDCLKLTKQYINASIEIQGSYRRGLARSGDIDVLIVSDEYNSTLFEDYFLYLLHNNFILSTLKSGLKKQVFCRIDDIYPARRVDLLYTTREQYPFATLYFTGSKDFTVRIRERAKLFGFVLNEYGIYKFTKTKTKTKSPNYLSGFVTERDIFEFLQLEYKTPNERISSLSVVPITMIPSFIHSNLDDSQISSITNSFDSPSDSISSNIYESKKRKKFSSSSLSSSSKTMKSKSKSKSNTPTLYDSSLTGVSTASRTRRKKSNAKRRKIAT